MSHVRVHKLFDAGERGLGALFGNRERPGTNGDVFEVAWNADFGEVARRKSGTHATTNRFVFSQRGSRLYLHRGDTWYHHVSGSVDASPRNAMPQPKIRLHPCEWDPTAAWARTGRRLDGRPL